MKIEITESEPYADGAGASNWRPGVISSLLPLPLPHNGLILKRYRDPCRNAVPSLWISSRLSLPRGQSSLLLSRPRPSRLPVSLLLDSQISVRKKTPILSSSRDPSHERPRRCAQGKRRRNSKRKMPLEAMGCLIQEFFPSIATLLRSMLYGPYAIPYRIGNRACCVRSLVS